MNAVRLAMATKLLGPVGMQGLAPYFWPTVDFKGVMFDLPLMTTSNNEQLSRVFASTINCVDWMTLSHPSHHR